MLGTCSLTFSPMWNEKEATLGKERKDKQETKAPNQGSVKKRKSNSKPHAFFCFSTTRVVLGWFGKVQNKLRKVTSPMEDVSNKEKRAWGGKSHPHVWRLPPSSRIQGKSPRILEGKSRLASSFVYIMKPSLLISLVWDLQRSVVVIFCWSIKYQVFGALFGIWLMCGCAFLILCEV